LNQAAIQDWITVADMNKNNLSWVGFLKNLHRRDLHRKRSKLRLIMITKMSIKMKPSIQMNLTWSTYQKNIKITSRSYLSTIARSAMPLAMILPLNKSNTRQQSWPSTSSWCFVKISKLLKLLPTSIVVFLSKYSRKILNVTKRWV